MFHFRMRIEFLRISKLFRSITISFNYNTYYTHVRIYKRERASAPALFTIFRGHFFRSVRRNQYRPAGTETPAFCCPEACSADYATPARGSDFQKRICCTRPHHHLSFLFIFFSVFTWVFLPLRILVVLYNFWFQLKFASADGYRFELCSNATDSISKGQFNVRCE